MRICFVRLQVLFQFRTRTNFNLATLTSVFIFPPILHLLHTHTRTRKTISEHCGVNVTPRQRSYFLYVIKRVKMLISLNKKVGLWVNGCIWGVVCFMSSVCFFKLLPRLAFSHVSLSLLISGATTIGGLLFRCSSLGMHLNVEGGGLVQLTPYQVCAKKYLCIWSILFLAQSVSLQCPS